MPCLCHSDCCPILGLRFKKTSIDKVRFKFIAASNSLLFFFFQEAHLFGMASN